MRVVAWAIMATDKDEFPPLLPEGFHSKALADIRTLCVDNPQFARSSTRERIMGRLDAAVKRLADAGIVGELWIDGSFLTQKINPEDVDLSLKVDGDFYDNAS